MTHLYPSRHGLLSSYGPSRATGRSPDLHPVPLSLSRSSVLNSSDQDNVLERFSPEPWSTVPHPFLQRPMSSLSSKILRFWSSVSMFFMFRSLFDSPFIFTSLPRRARRRSRVGCGVVGVGVVKNPSPDRTVTSGSLVVRRKTPYGGRLCRVRSRASSKPKPYLSTFRVHPKGTVRPTTRKTVEP